MRSHRLVILAAGLALLGISRPCVAQTPSVLYTWDHAIGAGAGANNEGWAFGFGANSLTLSNATDGVFSITEANAGTDWAISDNFNTIKESAARTNLTGSFGFGGLDLTGLSAVELDFTNNGTSAVSGNIFFQSDGGGGCCSFKTVGFTANPGANTISASLAAAGITANEQKFIRTIGLQVFGDVTRAVPFSYDLSEIRSVGTPLTQRAIADYSSAAALDGVVVKFDEAAVSGGGAADSQTGLSLNTNTLRWVDLSSANGASGAAVAWGNNNANAVNFLSRPLDISNYVTAEVTMSARLGGGGGDPTLGVQLFAQFANRATGNEFDFLGTNLSLPTDGQFHTLSFPMAALGSDLDLVQWLGLNLDPHLGNMEIRVQKVVLVGVPEPATVVLVGLSLVGVAVARRRRAA